MVVEEEERELGTEESITVDPLYNAVQSIVPLELPTSLRQITYRDWMRIRAKWILNDMECFVCVRNAQCVNDIDTVLVKSNRSQLRKDLKDVIHNDPL